MNGVLKKLIDDESGATAIEYSLIATLIATAIIGGAGAFGTSLGDMWDTGSALANGIIGG